MSRPPFAAGDPVLVRLLGKGIVREVRNGGRYLVDVGGRSVVVESAQLTPFESSRKSGRVRPGVVKRAPAVYDAPSQPPRSLDLHGLTVDEATEAVAGFLNEVLLSGAAEVHIIHGRSGGKLKAALHRQLRGIASIRSFALDPRNDGVTIVKL